MIWASISTRRHSGDEPLACRRRLRLNTSQPGRSRPRVYQPINLFSTSTKLIVAVDSPMYSRDALIGLMG